MMSRNSLLLIAAATTLLASPGRAIAPQTGSGGGSGSSGGSATTVRSRCTTCSPREDRRVREKLILRIDSLRWEIENKRLTDEQRARAARELNATVRALQQSLDEESRSTSVATAVVEARAAEEAAGVAPFAIAMPRMRARGYLGVTLDGPSAEIARPGDYSFRFYRYPRIALVEPSSPAERAGVLQGDTLMSFNGTDVVGNEISLTKLLVPDARIVMRVRRGGVAKDFNVTVGLPPDYYVRRREPGVAVSTGRIASVPSIAVGAEPVRVEVIPAAPSAGGTREAPVAFWYDYEGVAGARVETVTEGLGKAIGVDEGVLVVRARPGTPAYRSGLRDGDVIVKAGGQAIRGVPALRNAISMGDGEEGVRLLIVRERKQKDLTLRWQN